MGTNNRAKRAAKAKQRGREQHAHQGHTERGFRDAADPGLTADYDLRALINVRIQDRDATSQLAAFRRNGVRYQQQAVDGVFDDIVDHLFSAGWTPDDVREISRRRVQPALVDYAMRVVATRSRTVDPTTIAPAWLAGIDGIADAEGCRAWADEQLLSWDDARGLLLDLTVALASLGPITDMPQPGEYRRLVDDARGVDQRILTKVRGLLAKAESTDFEEEADALTAKAQDLMKTHSIENALLTEKNDERRERPAVRRIWIEAPYVEPKAALIDAVADSNRCRCVFDAQLGLVTLIGFSADLDAVELLSTSLLFQASRLMRDEGSRRYRDGGSRTRSFRQSFLIAYGGRIGERLREAAADTESRINAEQGGRLLPVLAVRDDDVTARTNEAFPNVVAKSMNVLDREGYGAGRRAADEAHIELRDAIADDSGR